MNRHFETPQAGREDLRAQPSCVDLHHSDTLHSVHDLVERSRRGIAAGRRGDNHDPSGVGADRRQGDPDPDPIATGKRLPGALRPHRLRRVPRLLLILGRSHLERALRVYTARYNGEAPRPRARAPVTGFGSTRPSAVGTRRGRLLAASSKKSLLLGLDPGVEPSEQLYADITDFIRSTHRLRHREEPLETCRLSVADNLKQS
jgi:hypothetical protein